MIILLPWPDRRLSPNARGHWAVLHAAKKKARWDAAYATYEAAGSRMAEIRTHYAGAEPIALLVRFVPPDNRHRDADNIIASLKPAMDGIADALEVNDRRFRGSYVFAEPEKPGRIEIVLESPESSISTGQTIAPPLSGLSIDSRPSTEAA
jgi:crossover junction endodeoxyribonuclease RusA